MCLCRCVGVTLRYDCAVPPFADLVSLLFVKSTRPLTPERMGEACFVLLHTYFETFVFPGVWERSTRI